ncbi:MAG: hypothetical protein QG604_424 [Candidatus Dependentiae bacterium]|nr:hypothetical protein [Candidatus Dependentiae bacterium]
MIFGRCGSGKSTFSAKLHAATDLPLHHLDKYFWAAGWVERDYAEFLQLHQAIIDRDAWIIDGNILKTIDVRYSRADLVILFCYPRWRCYWRAIKRYFVKDRAIDDRADGCGETLQWTLLKFIWVFEQRVAGQIKELRAQYPAVRYVEVRSDADLRRIERELIKGIANE